MVELNDGLMSTILSFPPLQSYADPVSSRKWRKHRKIHVDLFCSGEISENLDSARVFTWFGSDTCVFTTQIGLLERLVSFFRLFRRFLCHVWVGEFWGKEMIERDWKTFRKRFATSCTLCSILICGETVASITFPQKCGTNWDGCIGIRLRFVRSHWCLFEPIPMDWYGVLFRLGWKLVFDVSVFNQTGRRLDMQSCLATLGTFCARIRLF